MRYLKVVLPLLLVLTLVGCPSSDSSQQEVLRPFAEVYNEDIAEIELFLNDYTMSVDTEYNVTFSKITALNPGQKIKDRTDLTFKTVSRDGVDYKLYYIKLREGTETDDKPTVLDSVYTAYKGFKPDLTVFDQAQNPVWFTLEGVITGWGEVFPEFKPGTFATNSNGTVNYNNFGAGVMFVPSGLAYYNRSITTIGSYQPIIFSFKLMRSRFRDHDGDKLLSKDEYGPLTSDPLNEDGDNFPNYRDIDDDNDAIFTKDELRIANSLKMSKLYYTSYYDFNAITNCSGATKKRHLDKNCKQ